MKGAVLKTARRREASRGFESHPRRLDKPKCSISSDFERSLRAYKLPPALRSNPQKPASDWASLGHNWAALPANLSKTPRMLARSR